MELSKPHSPGLLVGVAAESTAEDQGQGHQGGESNKLWKLKRSQYEKLQLKTLSPDVVQT